MIKKIFTLCIVIFLAVTNYAFARDEQSSLNDNNTVQTKVLQQTQQKLPMNSLLEKPKQPKISAEIPKQKDISTEKKVTPKTQSSSPRKIPIQKTIQSSKNVDKNIKSATNSAPKILQQPKVILVSQPVIHSQYTNIPSQNPIPNSSNLSTPPIKPTDLDAQIIEQAKPLPPLPDGILKSPLKIQASEDIQTYNKISLPEAIDYALCHNLDIKGNRLNVDISRNDIKTANRLKNPYLISFFNFGKAATDNPNTIGLLFPIDILKRGPRKNLAKSTLELTKGNVALAELNLRLDTRQAYIDLVAAKSMLKILDQQRQLLQELLIVAQKKYDAGAAPEMDIIQAKMTLNHLLIQENSARTEVLVARHNFNKILNSRNLDTKEDYLPEQKDFIFLLTPKPVEKMPEFSEITDIALSKRIDLINAQQSIDVAQKNLVTVVRQRIPDVELGGGYMFVSPQLATSGTLAQGVFLAGNITNIPLLYQYTPEIKNAKLQVEQKQLAYCSLRNQAVMNLHSAYDSFTTSQANLNYYNDILLSESKQFLSMAKRSYEVGKTNITNYIFIQQSYKAILLGYTTALADYYNAWIDILREVNYEELKLHG